MARRLHASPAGQHDVIDRAHVFQPLPRLFPHTSSPSNACCTRVSFWVALVHVSTPDPSCSTTDDTIAVQIQEVVMRPGALRDDVGLPSWASFNLAYRSLTIFSLSSVSDVEYTGYFLTLPGV